MFHGNSLIVGAALSAALVVGCGKTEAPRKAEPAKVEPATAVAQAPSEVARPAAAVAPPSATGVPKQAGEGDSQAARPAEDATPAIDKEKLTKAYQAVYCAQKKGEMDKILGIYKEYGFDTPQAFTKTWIEASKDTDWVTKIAHEVGKKCP
jgi:hypothetical protein